MIHQPQAYRTALPLVDQCPSESHNTTDHQAVPLDVRGNDRRHIESAKEYDREYQ
jgi:hypothetical protein